MNRKNIFEILLGFILVLSLSIQIGASASSITGNINVRPNTQETYTINLDAPYPIDNDYLDGTYQYRYANWAFIDKDSKVIAQGDQWENIQNNFQKTVTVTIPQTEGRYAIIGIMTEINMTFENNQWKYSEEIPIEKQSLQISNNPNDVITPGFDLAKYWWLLLIPIGIGAGYYLIKR